MIFRVKELSYFHPDSFKIDDGKAVRNGWSPHEDNFFIRAVMWRANHDIGKSGWSDEVFIALINKLKALGKVHISSERSLPEELEAFRYKGKKADVHHLMAKCRLYVGESACMAQEAAFLGAPAIYDGHDVLGSRMVAAFKVNRDRQTRSRAPFDGSSEIRRFANSDLRLDPDVVADPGDDRGNN